MTLPPPAALSTPVKTITHPTPLANVSIVVIDAPNVFLNYYFLMHDAAGNDGRGLTVAVDCGQAAPVLAALDQHGWSLDEIWLTHHHWDHVEGVADLVAATGATVLGASHNAPRATPNPEPGEGGIPALDRDLAPGSHFDFAGQRVDVIGVEGHADGHVAYHIAALGALFSGDSLMALGCGRLIDGTAPQMFDSLTRLAALPATTQVFSGHEYMRGNAAFARTVDPDNAALAARADATTATLDTGGFTVPSTLAEELATNPFLRAGDPGIRAQLGMAGASDVEVFAEIRRRKDLF